MNTLTEDQQKIADLEGTTDALLEMLSQILTGSIDLNTKDTSEIHSRIAALRSGYEREKEAAPRDNPWAREAKSGAACTVAIIQSRLRQKSIGELSAKSDDGEKGFSPSA